jgi:hypothetical protein
MAKGRKKWQKEFIKRVFKQKKNDDLFSDIILSDMNLLNSKNVHLPSSLYKFYTTTSENLMDIKNKRMWLSHPSTFNDPYDCTIGINEEEYEKRNVLEYIKKYNLLDDSSDEKFSQSEFNEISNSCINDEEFRYIYSIKQGYSRVMYRIMQNKNQSLQDKIQEIRKSANDDSKRKIDNIRETNIRVTCFLAPKPRGIYYVNNKNDECLSKIQMWSHYANNHKGFCVEYDISSLKNDSTLNCENLDYYKDTKKEEYMAERLSTITKGGLFPVIYTSQRVNLPYTKLVKYKLNKRNDIIETLYKAYITKSTEWSYENEWRLIVDEKVSDYYANKIPFPYIKRIYLGCRMDKHHIKELMDIAKEINVEIGFMKMESHKFDLNYTSSFSYEFEEDMRLIKNPYMK